MSAQRFVFAIALAHSAASLKLPKDVPGYNGLDLASNGTKCNATVAYVFLTPGGLPLWPVWDSYFRGCPAGSFTVLVHTQVTGGANVVSSVGGEELPASETLQGDLRFSYKNVNAMLNLFGGVHARGAATNGCRPQWVHLSSESCAPVTTCDKVHAYLEQYPSESFIDRIPSEPPSNDTVFKSLQWVTLASEHAFALWRDREALRVRWEGSQKLNALYQFVVTFQDVDYLGAVEELVWPQELAKRGFKMHGYQGLTHVAWNVNSDGYNDGHPRNYSSADEASSASKLALDTGHFFARKFVDSPEVIERLLQNLM